MSIIKSNRPKAAILHGIRCHYEMLGSVIEQFKNDYDLYIVTTPFNLNCEELQDWLALYKRLTVLPNLIDDPNELIDLNPDVCIIHTDDDHWSGSVYCQFFLNKPLIIVRHIDIAKRTNVAIDENVHILTIQGVPDLYQRTWSCMWNGITAQDKFKKLSTRPLICVLGDIINEEDDFLKLMMNRITNFNEIDVFIANRNAPTQETELYNTLPNVLMVSNCSTQFMFEMLTRAHYVYFFAHKRGTHTSSAAFPISFTMLCRMISCSRCKNQYGLESPLFYDMDDKFEIKPINKKDIENVERERQMLIERTSKLVNNCMIVSKTQKLS